MRLAHQEPALSKFNERIKAGMDARWSNHETTFLIKKWGEVYGERRSPSRQAFYDWMKATSPKIDISNLYLLSDLLEVNARWLALGPPTPITKPFVPDDKIKVLIDAYKALQPDLQDELIKEAHKLLRLQAHISRAKPFM